jgi:hypothetical protein
MGDWRSFKFTVDQSGGVEGVLEAITSDVPGDRHSFLYLVNDTVGEVLESAAVGEEAVLIYHAEKELVPKETESTDIFLPGMRVYWNPATRLVTPTYDSGYFWIGICTEPAAAEERYVEIDLKGDHAEVEAVLP